MPLFRRNKQNQQEDDDDGDQQYRSGDEEQEQEDDNDPEPEQEEDNDDEQPANTQRRGAGKGSTRQQKTVADDNDDEEQEPEQEDEEDGEDDEGKGTTRRRGAAKSSAPQQEAEDEDEDEENDARGHQRGVAAGEEEEEEEGEDEAPATHYQSENKPMSDPEETDPDELYQAAIIVMKHLLVQTHNAQGVAAGTHNHTSASDQPVGAHPNDDWRIQYLQTQDADGNNISLEAKLDTGADQNFISVNACELHGLEIEELPPGEAPSFKVGSGASTTVEGQVFMRYKVGNPPTAYSEQFYAMDGLPHDIILGMPFLLHSHALTINPAFAHPQDNGDFLILETTAAGKKTPAQRTDNVIKNDARHQQNFDARKAAVAAKKQKK